MSATTGTSTALDEHAVYTDPATADVWHHEGAWWAPLAWRPHLGALGLGAVMAMLTVVIAFAADLPVRDADGLFGHRMVVLVATLAGFFALEILPRAFVRARRGMGPVASVRAVLDERWSRRRLRVVGIGLLAFYLTYLAYRNLKSYLPFLVDQNRDPSLLSLDRSMFFGHDPAELLHQLLGTGIAAHVLSFVYIFYLAFIPISLGAALILASNPVPGMWWVTALGINWTLGAASYFLIPSVGPAFADPAILSGLPHTGVTALQDSLWTARAQVLSDPFATNEVQSIAAFASLHTSVVFSAAIIAHVIRVPRVLRVSLWAFLGLVLLSTMYFGWHYLIDDFAGLAIGAIAVVAGAALTGHWRVMWEQPAGG